MTPFTLVFQDFFPDRNALSCQNEYKSKDFLSHCKTFYFSKMWCWCHLCGPKSTGPQYVPSARYTEEDRILNIAKRQINQFLKGKLSLQSRQLHALPLSCIWGWTTVGAKLQFLSKVEWSTQRCLGIFGVSEHLVPSIPCLLLKLHEAGEWEVTCIKQGQSWNVAMKNSKNQQAEK